MISQEVVQREIWRREEEEMQKGGSLWNGRFGRGIFEVSLRRVRNSGFGFSTHEFGSSISGFGFEVKLERWSSGLSEWLYLCMVGRKTRATFLALCWLVEGETWLADFLGVKFFALFFFWVCFFEKKPSSKWLVSTSYPFRIVNRCNRRKKISPDSGNDICTIHKQI